jgi:hypothetical protein
LKEREVYRSVAFVVRVVTVLALAIGAATAKDKPTEKVKGKSKE